MHNSANDVSDDIQWVHWLQLYTPFALIRILLWLQLVILTVAFDVGTRPEVEGLTGILKFMGTNRIIYVAHYRGVIAALVVSNLVSSTLLLAKCVSDSSGAYLFLLWNLVLAWLPVLFASWLVYRLSSSRWLSWKNIMLTFLWVLFLPNSFYLASDLVHLRLSSQANVLFDSIMLLSFVFNGFVAGMISMFLVHRELHRRFWASHAHGVIAIVLLAASFAIYLGRYLRWNTWDVVLNPVGLLFDVSDRVVNPGAYPQVFSTTLGFFVLLGSVYLVTWQFAQAIRKD